MKTPIPYKGNEPYIFISYAHKDSERVWPVIARLQADGYRVWYDEGIDPGTEWDENIAYYVKRCGYFIAFMSEAYLASGNCRDELNYARDLEKKQVLVYLDEVELPKGMALRFSRFQSFRADRPGFIRRLYETEEIEKFTSGIRDRRKAWWIPASLVSILVVALIMPGFFQKEPESKVPEEKPEEEPVATQQVEIPVTFKQTAFLSDSDVKLTAQDLYFEEDGDLCLEVQLENTSDKAVDISWSDIYLNGHQSYVGLLVEGEDIYTHYIYGAEPNVNMPAKLIWKVEDLETCGLGSIRDPKQITCIEGQCQLTQEGQVSSMAQILFYPYGQEAHIPLSYGLDEEDVVLADRQDYKLIFTGCRVNEKGTWVGEFLHMNLSDRHLTASMNVEQTNGYVTNTYETARVRPESMVYTYTRLPEWQVTQCDAVRRLDGWYYLYDTRANEKINEQTAFVLYPEGDPNITFPLRTLNEEDTVLLENEYIRLALIEEYAESEKCYAWRVYCVNLSNQELRVTLTDRVENGEPGYDWYMGILKPGCQFFATERHYHYGESTQYIGTGDLVVIDNNDNDQELSRDPLRLEFHW
ncbi:MAG: toll/interleukin-1 receptor domain-containing protein [Clostridia bacterium]|nr:toll/interleukin-1 receptor domain-containing protein [Clostridia bacterium]